MTSQDVTAQESTRNESGQQTATQASDVTETCVGITEKYRAGTISKVGAILELQSTIPHDVETTYLDTLGAYIQILDNFEHIRGRTLSSGTAGNEVENDKPGTGDRADELEEIVVTGQNKRARSNSVGTDDGSAKQKINASTFA